MKRPSLKFVRRSVQVAVLAVVAVAPLLGARGVHLFSGNFFFFDLAGLPLADPLAALQAASSAGGVGGRVLAGAALVLGLAALLGPVFCSWACPYGLLCDVTDALRAKAVTVRQGRLPAGYASKLAVFAAGLLAVAACGLPPLLNHVSLPGWYARIFQQPGFDFPALPFAVFALALVLDGVAKERFWCRRVCPQSVLPALAGRLLPFGLRIAHAPGRCACGPASPCRQACGLDLNPRRPGGPGLSCTHCGDCVSACASRGGALSFDFGPRRVAGERASTTPARQE
jgi:ferredoxin-type protein NapH